MCFSRFSLTTYPAGPLFILFSLTLLRPFPHFVYHLPCWALTYFIFTYPAPSFSRFSLTTYEYPAVTLSRFSITAYPAVLLFFFALTLPSHCPAFRLPPTLLTTYPAVLLFFYALTLLCAYCSAHLPCWTLIFLYTYPAGPLFFYALTLLCTYPALRLALTVACTIGVRFFCAHTPRRRSR